MAPLQKAPIVTPELRKLLATTPGDTRAGLRDRALLLIAKRSEELCPYFGAALAMILKVDLYSVRCQ